MKMIAMMLCVGLLTGCSTLCPTPKDPQVAVKYKYVVNQIPDDMFTIPGQPYTIDPDLATDKDAAEWMLTSEARYIEIEKKLKAIKDFQEKKLKGLTYPAEDVIRN